MKKVRTILKILLLIIIVLWGLFLVNMQNYYHSKPFDNKLVAVQKSNNYHIYGDMNSDTVLIFYPGAKVEASAYEPLLSLVASEANICVISIEMPHNLAILDSGRAKHVFEDFNFQHYYIGGHSLGGSMAINYASKNQDKLEGVILLASYGVKECTLPVLSIYGDHDEVLNKENFEENQVNTPNATVHVLTGGNHAQFGNYGEQKGDGEATISKELQWQLASDLIVDFIKK